MTFGELTGILLFEKENYGKLHQVLHALHDFYAQATGISAEQTADRNVFLSTGKAISPGQAAYCLLDIQRTIVFLRGIHKAILQLKKDVDGPVHILYAGCGPYATLLTPLTTLFTPQEVRFHMMDINQESLPSVDRLYTYLQMRDYIEEFICGDAAAYTIEKPVHLIISETMQPALSKEPQVSIMQNLLPQLNDKGIFIPQEIIITAQLADLDKEMKARMEEGVDPERINLGTVYTIGMDNCCSQHPVTLEIPLDSGTNDELYLFTQVKVFEDERLEPDTCSLTISYHIANIGPLRGRHVQFEYVISQQPGFKWKVMENSLENWAR